MNEPSSCVCTLNVRTTPVPNEPRSFEAVGATQGVGELIYSAEHNFDANGVFAGMLLLAAMALVAEALITALENRLITWRPNAVSSEMKV